MKNNKRVVGLSEQKKRFARELLKSTLGLCIKLESGIVLALKAAAICPVDLELSSKRKLLIFAISNSATEVRNFENIFWTFKASFKSLFSIRDMSLPIIQDYICRYLQANLYSQESERPIPLEVFLVEIQQGGGIACAAIDHNGEVLEMGEICMIGCPDVQVREGIASKLKKADLSKMPVETVAKLAEEVTGPFRGNLCVLALSIVRKGKPATVATAPTNHDVSSTSQPT